MPSKGSCKVCTHTRVLEIDRELLSSGMGCRSLRGIAALSQVSHETMRRHYQRCLGLASREDLGNMPQILEPAHEVSIKFTHDHVDKVLELNNRAQSCGNPVQFMVIIRELLELLASLVKSV